MPDLFCPQEMTHVVLQTKDGRLWEGSQTLLSFIYSGRNRLGGPNVRTAAVVFDHV